MTTKNTNIRAFKLDDWNVTVRKVMPVTVNVTAVSTDGRKTDSHMETLVFNSPEKAERWVNNVKINFIKVWLLNRTNEAKAKTFKPEQLKTFC